MTKEQIIAAVKFATTQTELSNSMLQIEFKMGFHWAYKMMDILEKNLIVEPFKGNPTRKVLNNNSDKDNTQSCQMAVISNTVHELKILVQYADLHLTNKKNWELRKNDRNFKTGDIIKFTIVSNITGLPMYNSGYERTIDFVFEGGEYGLEKGYCILSIS